MTASSRRDALGGRRGRRRPGRAPAAIAAWSPGRGCRLRVGRSARRASSRRPATAGIAHTYDGGLDVRSTGGGVAVFDCDGDGRPDVYLAGGGGPAALFRNDSPVGGALRFAAVARPGDRPRRASPAPTRSTSTATASPTSRSCGSARRELLRGLGDCRFERAERGAGASTPSTGMDDRVQRDLGGRGDAADARVRQLPRARRRRATATYRLRRQRAVPAGRRRATRLRRRRSRCRPATARCRSCSATGTGRAARDLRVSNDRHYYDVERRGAALAHRARRGAARRTRPPTAGRRMQIWGMGIASQDLTGDGYPEVYLTSQGDNKLQTLAAGPGAARRTATSRSQRGVDRRPAVRRRRRAALDRLAPRVRGRQQRRLHRPVRLQGQRRRAARLRDEGPEQPVPRPGRRHVRRGRRGGRAS